MSSVRSCHSNLLCVVPILTYDPRRESLYSSSYFQWLKLKSLNSNSFQRFRVLQGDQKWLVENFIISFHPRVKNLNCESTAVEDVHEQVNNISTGNANANKPIATSGNMSIANWGLQLIRRLWENMTLPPAHSSWTMPWKSLRELKWPSPWQGLIRGRTIFLSCACHPWSGTMRIFCVLGILTDDPRRGSSSSLLYLVTSMMICSTACRNSLQLSVQQFQLHHALQLCAAVLSPREASAMVHVT